MKETSGIWENREHYKNAVGREDVIKKIQEKPVRPVKPEKAVEDNLVYSEDYIRKVTILTVFLFLLAIIMIAAGRLFFIDIY